MTISMITPNIRLDDAPRSAVEQKLSAVMGRISTRIDHVAITLTDVNAQKGGVDKQCRVRVTVRGLGTVITDGRHENVLTSIDKALRRARRVILKQLKRRITRSRKQPSAYTVSNGILDVAFAN